MNPVFAAYCRAVGVAPTVEALRARDGDWAEFLCWVGARRAEWRAAHGGREPVEGRDTAAWVAHCGAAAAKGAA